MSDITKKFKENLVSGHYKSLGGARRGAGKYAEATEDDRKKMRAMADEYFPEEAAPSKTEKAAKPAKAAKAVKAVKEAAPKVAPVKAKAVKAVEAAAKVAAKAPEAEKKTRAKRTPAAVVVAKDAGTSLGTYEQALRHVASIKEISDGKIDVTPLLKLIHEGVSQTLSDIVKVSSSVAAAPVPSVGFTPPVANGSGRLPVVPTL